MTYTLKRSCFVLFLALTVCSFQSKDSHAASKSPAQQFVQKGRFTLGGQGTLAISSSLGSETPSTQWYVGLYPSLGWYLLDQFSLHITPSIALSPSGLQKSIQGTFGARVSAQYTFLIQRQMLIYVGGGVGGYWSGEDDLRWLLNIQAGLLFLLNQHVALDAGFSGDFNFYSKQSQLNNFLGNFGYIGVRVSI
ncbi:MAG TPA: hypothetical protein DCE42_25900 [Myxococcales bacterium]|nr:hypothetical protein [Deltaproteobacteria bacterium]HAA58224.1 hypothetical protein [Myxococcales bacterium]|tara:strand:- start:2499 stop:3077 length:579 start_codon:yes stop_codon:yes gene_type:complete